MQTRPEGHQPTNPAKHQQIEENMDRIARLVDENLRLELEIRLERLHGKVVSLCEYRVTRAMLNRRNPDPIPQPDPLPPDYWAAA